ncbi:MAG: hypothetical protein K8T91_26900, partial [Planctomycetes bacterium]|nr:hypothetical protein [Planctomycetota bacterium]
MQQSSHVPENRPRSNWQSYFFAAPYYVNFHTHMTEVAPWVYQTSFVAFCGLLCAVVTIVAAAILITSVREKKIATQQDGLPPGTWDLHRAEDAFDLEVRHKHSGFFFWLVVPTAIFTVLLTITMILICLEIFFDPKSDIPALPFLIGTVIMSLASIAFAFVSLQYIMGVTMRITVRNGQVRIYEGFG